MKKQVLITLMLSILLPGFAGAMNDSKKVITIKENPDNTPIINQLINEKRKKENDEFKKNFEAFEKALKKDLERRVKKHLLRKKKNKLQRLANDEKKHIERIKKELREEKGEKLLKRTQEEHNRWSKKRIALVLVPTLLTGAGVATWYFWDKIPVKTIKKWLLKTFVPSWYRRK